MEEDDVHRLSNEIFAQKSLNYMPCILPLFDYYVWFETNQDE
jgi:hypothetical protein